VKLPFNFKDGINVVSLMQKKEFNPLNDVHFSKFLVGALFA
jgi:hypothetical protein